MPPVAGSKAELIYLLFSLEWLYKTLVELNRLITSLHCTYPGIKLFTLQSNMGYCEKREQENQYIQTTIHPFSVHGFLTSLHFGFHSLLHNVLLNWVLSKFLSGEKILYIQFYNILFKTSHKGDWSHKLTYVKKHVRWESQGERGNCKQKRIVWKRRQKWRVLEWDCGEGTSSISFLRTGGFNFILI